MTGLVPGSPTLEEAARPSPAYRGECSPERVSDLPGFTQLPGGWAWLEPRSQSPRSQPCGDRLMVRRWPPAHSCLQLLPAGSCWYLEWPRDSQPDPREAGYDLGEGVQEQDHQEGDERDRSWGQVRQKPQRPPHSHSTYVLCFSDPHFVQEADPPPPGHPKGVSRASARTLRSSHNWDWDASGGGRGSVAQFEAPLRRTPISSTAF